LKLHVTPGKPPRDAPPDDIPYKMSKQTCRTLFLERRDAQRQGVLDFTAHFDFDRGLGIESGRPYRVGRLDFIGNHHYSDALVRGQLAIEEGAIFDERLLRRSVARLNRSGFFDSIDERHILVRRDPAAGIADVTLRLTERKRGAWNL